MNYIWLIELFIVGRCVYDIAYDTEQTPITLNIEYTRLQ